MFSVLEILADSTTDYGAQEIAVAVIGILDAGGVYVPVAELTMHFSRVEDA